MSFCEVHNINLFQYVLLASNSIEADTGSDVKKYIFDKLWLQIGSENVLLAKGTVHKVSDTAVFENSITLKLPAEHNHL